jgi:hypothetical protein
MPQEALVQNHGQEGIQRHGNFSTVSLPEGSVTIAYGLHVQRKTPPPSFSQAGGLILEAGLFDYPNDSELQRDMNENFTNVSTYMINAANLGIPMVAADCNLQPWTLLDNLTPAMEIIAAQKLLKTAVQLNPEARNYQTRRQFLGKLTGIAAGFYAIPIVGVAGRVASSMSGKGEEEFRSLRKITGEMFPEYSLFTVSLRNAVLAQKIHFLLKETQIAHPWISLGSDHVQIEESLLEDEENRLNYLQKFKEVLPFTVVPDTFYKMNIYEPSHDGYHLTQVLEEPSLKRIISN